MFWTKIPVFSAEFSFTEKIRHTLFDLLPSPTTLTTVFQAGWACQYQWAKAERGTSGILRKWRIEEEQRRSNQAIEKVFKGYQSTVLHRVCHCILGCGDTALSSDVVESGMTWKNEKVKRVSISSNPLYSNLFAISTLENLVQKRRDVLQKDGSGV